MMRPTRHALKSLLWLKYGCEARAWEREKGMEPHICRGGPTMHEFLYLKNDVPVAKQEYLDNELNCTPLCQWSHMKYQSSEAFRSWLARRRAAEFGELAVRIYLASAPLKIKTKLEQIL